MCNFRELNADEIKARVAMTSDKGLQILLYKNARVDMAILDETVGAARWQREHYSVDGVNYCRVGIKIENEWIWKSDCGSESNTEAEKGEASDSFKRACVCWGIGRSLYTAPFIWVKAGEYSLNSKGKPADTFSVSAIDIKDGVIKGLAIKNDKSGKIVYTYGTLRGTSPASQNVPQLPFPEAGTSPKAEPNLPPMVFRMSREEAAKIEVQGVTLPVLYKTNKAAFMAVLNENPDPKIREAAQVIFDWVQDFKTNNK